MEKEPAFGKKFNVTKAYDGSNWIIRIEGTLSLYSMSQFKQQTDDMKISTGQKIILDISNLTHIDSAGIGSLLRFSNMVKGPKAHLFLTRPSGNVEQIFKVTGLLNVFQFID